MSCQLPHKNPIKEVNLLILRQIVKTDKLYAKNVVFYGVLTVLVNFVACNFGRVTIHDATAKDRSGYYPAGTADISIKGLTARCLHLAFSSNLSANVMNPDWSHKKTFHTTSFPESNWIRRHIHQTALTSNLSDSTRDYSFQFREIDKSEILAYSV